jgi:hypothetical protein
MQMVVLPEIVATGFATVETEVVAVLEQLPFETVTE